EVLDLAVLERAVDVDVGGGALEDRAGRHDGAKVNARRQDAAVALPPAAAGERYGSDERGRSEAPDFDPGHTPLPFVLLTEGIIALSFRDLRGISRVDAEKVSDRGCQGARYWVAATFGYEGLIHCSCS